MENDDISLVGFDEMIESCKGTDRRMYEHCRNWDIPKAMEILTEAMKDDSYAIGWQANIAMAMVDSGVDHEVANIGAGRFMKLCFGRDTADLV